MDPELERLQRWMQAVVTHPGGIQMGMASRDANSNIAVDISQIETVVSPSLTLSGAERLAIYSRSYHARLIECFQSIFPTLLQALGEQLFDHFVIDYLQHYPPHSYTLGNVADDFPAHLEKTRPDADQPPENRESWPDLIIELAQLELAFIKVYDGPGVEGQALPNWPNVLMMPMEQLLGLRPMLVPGLRFFAFRYPVHTYWLAARRGETAELPEPAPSFVVMLRRNYRIQVYDLLVAQHRLLGMFDGRCTVDQALRQTSMLEIATVRLWLSEWIAKGFFQSLSN